MIKKKTIYLILPIALICILLGVYIGYSATPSGTVYLAGGTYPQGTSTIWREGSNYFSKSELGRIVYDDTNFTDLFTDTLNALPTNGGKILLKTGLYEGCAILDRSQVILEGEGSCFYEPPQWDNHTNRGIYGSVIRPLTGMDGILISGANRSGLQIRNLGIWFTSSSTGHGISTDGGAYLNCEDLVIENIDVLHHNSSHYAINLENFLEVSVRNINSVGGGLLRLYANWNSFHAGDSIFENMYARIIYDLPSDGSSAVGFPFIVARNGTRGNCWINDVVFDSILMNNPTSQTDSDFYGVVLWFARNMVFNHLHFEGVSGSYAYQWVNIGACYNIQFNAPYFWTYDLGYINSQNTNHKITWITPSLGGYNSDLGDGNQTNMWINLAYEGNITSGTVAGFEGLNGNDGWATLLSGQTSIIPQAKFISSFDCVLITIIDDSTLGAGESLKVESIDTANNQFTVKCIDEATASADITFYWEVAHSYST